MELGKLYQIKKYFWLLFPSKDIASEIIKVVRELMGLSGASTLGAAHDEDFAATAAAYWSKRFNCNVTYISENDIFCLIEEDGKYLKVLTTNGELGWIRYPEDKEWAKSIKEVA